MSVRNYQASDYEQLIALYKNSELFGGQCDPARDSQEKISKVTSTDPESVLVYEENGRIMGTVSLIENGRVAWLFRFAAHDIAVAKALYDQARQILTSRGHEQILVYSDPNNAVLNERYEALGMTAGNLFRCFWEEVESA